MEVYAIEFDPYENYKRDHKFDLTEIGANSNRYINYKIQGHMVA
jgi:hypothetical protein